MKLHYFIGEDNYKWLVNKLKEIKNLCEIEENRFNQAVFSFENPIYAFRIIIPTSFPDYGSDYGDIVEIEIRRHLKPTIKSLYFIFLRIIFDYSKPIFGDIRKRISISYMKDFAKGGGLNLDFETINEKMKILNILLYMSSITKTIFDMHRELIETSF